MKPDVKQKLHGLYLLLNILLVLTILFSLFSTLGFKRDSPQAENVEHINTVLASVDGGPWEELSLPHTFEELLPNTPVTVKTTIVPKQDDGVYIRSQYARAKVYLNNELAFTFGKPRNYPAFMMNPAVESHVVETYGTGKPMEVRIEYRSPTTDRDFSVHPLMVGSAKELILERSVAYGTSWSMALVQILGGIALFMISVGILLIDRKGILFTWLSLFALATGLWFLGGNSFAITIFPNSAWLYLASFIGFSSCIIPLLRFVRSAADVSDSRLIRCFEVLFTGADLLAIVLQLLKLCPLHQSWKLFRLAIPTALMMLFVQLLLERFRYNNPYAGRFILPAAVLSVTAILGAARNSGTGSVVPVTFPVFQVGVILFLLMMGVIAGASVKDSIDLKRREQLLEYEKSLLQIQTQEQRESRLLLAHNEAELSRQRHDLRHHLTVIQELSGDNPEIRDYLNTLMGKIPKARERFCENAVVNAIVSHFVMRCRQENITITTALSVPETGSRDRDSDLCLIFANLLENAVEACGRMEAGEKYIHIASEVQNKMLTVTMDNSFDGRVTKIGGRFRSSKRNDYGIGLSSVQAIVQDAHGGADFYAEGEVFHSLVFLSCS